MRYLFPILLLAIACGRGPEGTEPGDCSDGQDNDKDGKYDCEDSGCKSSEHCLKELAKIVAAAKAEAEKAATAKKAQEANDVKATKADGLTFLMDNLLVQTGHNGKNANQKQSMEYCKKLSLDGKSPWRLPTQEEAVKIVESGKVADGSSFVMWTSTKAGKKRGIIVGNSSGAANELGVVYDGDCRARCVHEIAK